MLWFGRKPRVVVDFATVLQALRDVLKVQRKLMADLTALQSAVAANTTAVSDVEAAVNALKATHSTDQAAIDALTTQITANNTAMEALKVTAVSS